MCSTPIYRRYLASAKYCPRKNLWVGVCFWGAVSGVPFLGCRSWGCRSWGERRRECVCPVADSGRGCGGTIGIVCEGEYPNLRSVHFTVVNGNPGATRERSSSLCGFNVGFGPRLRLWKRCARPAWGIVGHCGRLRRVGRLKGYRVRATARGEGLSQETGYQRRALR